MLNETSRVASAQTRASSRKTILRPSNGGLNGPVHQVRIVSSGDASAQQIVDVQDATWNAVIIHQEQHGHLLSLHDFHR